MPVTEFDFAALKDYITSSKDSTLRDIAAQRNRKYMGSSSSMTGVLAHFHYLLSAWRPVNLSSLSQGFDQELKTFTRLIRAPAAMFLRHKDGSYAIDADKEFDSANVLMNLGKSMEKLLTLPKEEYERYRRSHSNKITPEEEARTPESYHYSTVGDFLMRSQLDAYDPRLPGTGMFDLKTRAALSIRMDARDFEKGMGYQIKSRLGEYESFEREYYDMIRAAFLKYSLQVRIGRMDGIFVAFHNIERIFGFQYISAAEMDHALHGQFHKSLGDAEFRLSLKLWNKVLNKATARYPGKSLRFHFETRDSKVSGPYMYIFYEPVTEEEIDQIQTKNKAKIDAYQERVLNLANSQTSESDTSADDAESPSTSQADEAFKEIVDSAEKEASAEADSSTATDTSEADEEREVSGMEVRVLNYHNGTRVERPDNFSPLDHWDIKYQMTNLEGERVADFYKACKKRRQNALDSEGAVSTSGFLKKLWRISRQGRAWRRKQDEIDEKQGVVVLDDVNH